MLICVRLSRACGVRGRFSILVLIFALAQSGAELLSRLLSKSKQRLQRGVVLSKNNKVSQVFSFPSFAALLGDKDCVSQPTRTWER